MVVCVHQFFHMTVSVVSLTVGPTQNEGSTRRGEEVRELEARAAAILEEYAATATASSKQLNANLKAARDR